MPVRTEVKYLMPYISKIVCKGSYISFFWKYPYSGIMYLQVSFIFAPSKMKYRDCRNKIITFILALFFSPIFLAIPSFATAPALIVVGFFMMQSVAKINWSDMLEAIPAFICIFAMPFMYSISEGISFGVISFVVLNAVAGKAKKITPLMWVLAVLFILKYIVMS